MLICTALGAILFLMRRYMLFLTVLLACSFTQFSHAIASIQITADTIDAPVGQLKKATFQVDLKSKIPKLGLIAAVKLQNEKAFVPFNLTCGSLSSQAGDIDCFDGQLIAKPVSAYFSAHLAVQPNAFAADFLLNDASFSDETGAYAGEGLVGDIQFSGQKENQIWQWDGKIEWTGGEVYWQPFYFGEADNLFKINGTFAKPKLNIEYASLLIGQVGSMHAIAQINTATKQVENINIDAKGVDFNGLYDTFLKPKLASSAFDNLDVTGRASWHFEAENLQPKRFELNLKDANVVDNNGKFSFNNLNAHIPWDYDSPKNILLTYQSGFLLKLPLGEAKLTAKLNRYALTSPELTLPLLDGALHFQDVSAAWLGKDWAWHLRMDLMPITLREFSAAFEWPAMEGKISGQIPLVTYANRQLNMDGVMTFNAFKGSIAMSHLRIDEPLGIAPRLYADLSMRQLDLGELTRTYSFGAIEGKLDGKVKNLILEDWKPVSFDGAVYTSDDEQRRTISQRAVENITALGGGRASASLQRTFLRFFEQFNYQKIGLSCKLRQNFCEMGGIASTPTGYVIVKGEGIPAIDVNGYTKKVSLAGLLARIKRIANSNAQVIVE